MKIITVIVSTILIACIARADLVVQEQVVSSNLTFSATTKFHGNKMREDIVSDRIGNSSTISDLTTLDILNLSTEDKTFRKISGETMKQFVKRQEAKSGITNLAETITPKPTDTGKSEKVGEYETEIYFWSNGRGMTNVFWVAKNFPNLEAIKPYLVKLPGMVVKNQETQHWGTYTVTLLSAKVEDVEPSLFEVPNDYTAKIISKP